MMTAEEIKAIITKNKNDIAFVVGNGIHRHNNDEALSWEQLLLDLWNLVSSKRETKLIVGISHTEMYDIIELKLKERIRKINDGSYFKELGEKKMILSEETIHSINELHDKKNELMLSEKLLIALEKIKEAKPFDTNNINSNKTVVIPPVSKIDTTSMERVRELLHPYKSLDYEDCERINSKSITYAISRKMGEWEAKEHHRLITRRIQGLSAPILTTNYDEVLADAANATLMKLPNYGFTDYYPWSSYFSCRNLEHPLDDFGIWHINGMTKYHRSIRLGLCQYMGSVSQARKLIHKNKEELFTGKDQEYWGGRNTWLHIIFNRSLFIFGLALEENEVFLRWLLLQRANYFNKFSISHTGWYLTTSAEIKKSPGKRFFLESVGFKILEAKDFKTIYEDIWQ